MKSKSIFIIFTIIVSFLAFKFLKDDIRKSVPVKILKKQVLSKPITRNNANIISKNKKNNSKRKPNRIHKEKVQSPDLIVGINEMPKENHSRHISKRNNEWFNPLKNKNNKMLDEINKLGKGDLTGKK